MQITIAGWVLDIDVERTKATYTQITQGGCQTCGCAYCRNFLAALPTSFPRQILEFFVNIGIDSSKDAEVYGYGEVSSGILQYGGEYYLWGKVIQEPAQETRLPNEFIISFIQPTPLVQKEFDSEGALCLNFTGHIHWVLDSNN